MFSPVPGRERAPPWLISADDELMQKCIQRQYAQQSHDEINVSITVRVRGFPDAG